MRRAAVLAILCTVAIAVPVLAGVFPTFAAAYTLDADGNLVEYVESGVFVSVPICLGEWEVAPLAPTTTTDPRHLVVIQMSLTVAKWVRSVQKDLVVTGEEARCSTATSESVPECGPMTLDWGPEVPPENPSSRSPGWSLVEGSGISRVTGVPNDPRALSDIVPVQLELNYRDARPVYSLGTVPFTGRVNFADPATNAGVGDREATGDYIAGRCVNPWPSGTCDPRCDYATHRHAFEYSAIATRTQGRVPLPYGPLGAWTLGVEACNEACG